MESQVTNENADIALAAALRGQAIDFWEAAKYVQAGLDIEERGGSFKAPLDFLICHAAECLLKCALLKRGTAERELRAQNTRHSLKALLDKLDEYDLPISDRARAVLLGLDETHRKHWTRYPKREAEMIGGHVGVKYPYNFELLNELLGLTRISKFGK
ncbi:MAG: hypothetical protein AAFV19_20420 [Pseudomonadota bacterium]